MMIKALNSVKRDEENFMILQVNVPEEPEKRQYVHWVFDVDYSGSMSSRSSKDGHTRLQHVQSTLVNIIEYLQQHSERTSSIHKVSIIWFNHETNASGGPTLTFEIDKVTDLSGFKEEICKVSPNGSTSISCALNAADVLIPQKVLNQTALVFMSDGQPTAGNCNYVHLEHMVQKIVNRVEESKSCSFSTMFIGYGSGETGLMERLASVGTGEYHCIESEEGAGVVYGEITHNILSQQRKNVVIDVENGLIYDFKFNEWVKTLRVGDMPNGSERVFHVKTNTPETIKITMDYDDFKSDQDLWDHETDVITHTNIIKPDEGKVNEIVKIYKIRQEVLELLSAARAWKTENPYMSALDTPMMLRQPPALAMPPPVKRQTNAPTMLTNINIPSLNPLSALPAPPPTPPSDTYIHKPSPNRASSAPPSRKANTSVDSKNIKINIKPKYEVLKMKLEKKMADVKSYIGELTQENNQEYQKGIDILHMLTDDLFITIESLNKPYGLTNIIARHTSQGTQRAYNTVNAHDFNDTVSEHTVSDSYTSPYAAPSAAQCIRSISQPTTIGNCPSTVVSMPSSGN